MSEWRHGKIHSLTLVATEAPRDHLSASFYKYRAGDLPRSESRVLLPRWFGLFLDRMIGPDFAAGLAKLRSFCEKMPH